MSSTGLGLGVVELRLVPTPLSGGEDVPFTMGLPAGVCRKNRIRKAIRVSDINLYAKYSLAQLLVCSILFIMSIARNSKPIAFKEKKALITYSSLCLLEFFFQTIYGLLIGLEIKNKEI